MAKKGRRGLIVAVVVLTVLLVLGAAAGTLYMLDLGLPGGSDDQQPQSVSAPTWERGDQWVYDEQLYLIDEDGDRSTITDGVSTYAVVNENYCGEPPCRYRVKEETVEPDEDSTTHWLFDFDTLAAEEEGTDSGGGYGVAFPMEVGAQGKVKGWDFRVVTARELTVQAGTFWAFRIDFHHDEDDIETQSTKWYAPKVENFIKEDTQVSFDLLGSYYEIEKHLELMSYSR